MVLPRASAQSLPKLCSVPGPGLASTDLLTVKCPTGVSRAAEVAVNQFNFQVRVLGAQRASRKPIRNMMAKETCSPHPNTNQGLQLGQDLKRPTP